LVPLVIAICAGACGARSSRPTLPTDTRNEVLSHYVSGESLDKIALEFRLGDRDDARRVVHDAMVSLTKRYFRDR
jgi:hypothetical protein